MKPSPNVLLLVLLVAAGALYWRVTLTSPIVFGDEGNWAFHGRWIAENGIFPQNVMIYDTDTYHSPYVYHPLFPNAVAAAWLMGGDFGIKLLLPVFLLLGAALLYLFLRHWIGSVGGLAAALALLATPAAVTYGVLTYTDTMALLLILASVYFGFRSLETGTNLQAAVGGLLGGLALLTKVTGWTPLLVLLSYFVVTRKFARWKPFILFLVAFGLILTPWFAKNIILFDNVCFRPFPWGQGCNAFSEVTIPSYGFEFAGRTAQIGTESSVWQMGLLNWLRFAFGWSLLALAAMGLAALTLVFRNPYGLLLSLWLLLFVWIFFQTTPRAEDTARYVLPVVVPLAAIAGAWVNGAYNWIKQRNTWLAITIVLLVVASIWWYGQEKLDTMARVKAWSPGFFEACDWVRANTPPDATLFGTYAQQAAYSCHRPISYNSAADITLAANATSYDLLKLYGYDYVWVAQFTLSEVPYAESTPMQFVSWLESSQSVRKVFDNTDRWGRAGVKVYQVL